MDAHLPDAARAQGEQHVARAQDARQGRFHGRHGGGLGVVHKKHSALLTDDLEAVGRRDKVGKGGLGLLLGHAEGLASQVGGFHAGPLGAVAVAAATEDHEEPAGRELPGRAEHVVQGIRGVGVVHEHGQAGRVLHPLQPAGRTVKIGQGSKDGRRQVQGQGRAKGGQDIFDVVAPGHGKGPFPPRPPTDAT